MEDTKEHEDSWTEGPPEKWLLDESYLVGIDLVDHPTEYYFVYIEDNGSLLVADQFQEYLGWEASDISRYRLQEPPSTIEQ